MLAAPPSAAIRASARHAHGACRLAVTTRADRLRLRRLSGAATLRRHHAALPSWCPVRRVHRWGREERDTQPVVAPDVSTTRCPGRQVQGMRKFWPMSRAARHRAVRHTAWPDIEDRYADAAGRGAHGAPAGREGERRCAAMGRQPARGAQRPRRAPPCGRLPAVAGGGPERWSLWRKLMRPLVRS